MFICQKVSGGELQCYSTLAAHSSGPSVTALHGWKAVAVYSQDLCSGTVQHSVSLLEFFLVVPLNGWKKLRAVEDLCRSLASRRGGVFIYHLNG